MQMDRKKWLLPALALLLLAGTKFALLGWYLQHGQPVAAVVDVACASLADCRLPAGETLAVTPEVLAGKPFRIAIRTDATPAPQAEFSMADMDMGFNRYTFVREGEDWVATVRLPVCVSQRHDWLMTLTLDGQRYRIPFRTRVAGGGAG